MLGRGHSLETGQASTNIPRILTCGRGEIHQIGGTGQNFLDEKETIH